MKKLPHERLREAAKTEADIGNYYPCVVAAKDLGAMDDTRYDTEVKLLNVIADEIEKYYDPKLRFEDGELVNEGDKYIDQFGYECTISRFENRVTIWDENGEYERVDVHELLKRPEPKVLDADGVEIKVGDTVWPINDPEMKMVVDNFQRIYGQDMTANCEFEGEYYNFDVDKLTHREPDSLQKVQQLASDWAHEDNLSNSSAADFRDVMEEISDRLTAIMERDA